MDCKQCGAPLADGTEDGVELCPECEAVAESGLEAVVEPGLEEVAESDLEAVVESEREAIVITRPERKKEDSESQQGKTKPSGKKGAKSGAKGAMPLPKGAKPLPKGAKPSSKQASQAQYTPPFNPGRRFAITSLTLGIFSFFTPYMGIACAIVGLILGVVSINKSRAVRMPFGMAVAGSIASAFSFFVWLTIIF